MSVFESLNWKNVTPQVRALAVGERNMARLLDQTFVPIFPEGMTPKEKAVELLRAAAEVEHQFIVQYLYAYYCGGVAEADLFRIAKEEMGHLLTVQNLLAMLDAPPYLGRMGGGGTVEEPFLFTLEPFSISFIARFLVAESQDDAHLPADIMQHLPSTLPLETIKHVGAIYMALYWLFQDPNSPVGPWCVPLGADDSGFQELGHLADTDLSDPTDVSKRLSLSSNWPGSTDHIQSSNLNILVMPKDDWQSDKSKMRLAALNAIYVVAGQGEGPVALPEGTPEPAHAEQLAKIYAKLDNAPAPGPSPFPTNPSTTLRMDSADPDTYLISRQEAKDKANAFDVLYERLLLKIALSVLSPSNQTGAATDALDIMQEIDPAARTLVTMPRKDGNDMLKAAPPFTFPAGGIPADVMQINARLTALGS